MKGHSADADSDATMDKDDDSDSDSDNDSDSDTPSRDEHGAHSNGAQRTVDVARMLRSASDTTPLRVHVAYGAGSLSVLPVDGAWLYKVRLNYLPTQGSPSITYDPNSRSLSVGGSKHGDVDIEFGDHHGHSADELRVALARRVPLDLDLAFGAADANAQLGGLEYNRHLTIQTGARWTRRSPSTHRTPCHSSNWTSRSARRRSRRRDSVTHMFNTSKCGASRVM